MSGKLLTPEELNDCLRQLASDNQSTSQDVEEHISALTEKLRESEAGAAALRRAHGEPECWKYGHPSEDCTHYSSCSELRSALSSTAGRDLLERLRLAEKELVGRRESEDAQTKAHLAAIQRAEEAEAEHAKSEKELCAADGAVSKWKERAEKAEEERDNCLFELNRIEAIPDVSQCLYGGEVADAVQAAIDYLEADLAIAIKRAEAAEARVKELEQKLKWTECDCDGAGFIAGAGCADRCTSLVPAMERADKAEARVKELEVLASDACTNALKANLSWSKSDDFSMALRAALGKCVDALEDLPGMAFEADRREVIDAALRAARDAGVGT